MTSPRKDGRCGSSAPAIFFGEIGLPRDVPRVASVTALSEAELPAPSREDFLAALTQDVAHLVAESITLNRLAT